MSQHLASIRWSRDGKPFDYNGYSRDHEWSFDGGQRVRASASLDYLGSAESIDPEEALVAALSSCHMLTLLAIAAKKGWTIDGYEDDAVGTMGKNEAGRLAVTQVVLRPRITFAEGKAPDAAGLTHLHEQAHTHCFIANSVKTAVTIEPRDT